jgi:putative transcriptional regulator
MAEKGRLEGRRVTYSEIFERTGVFPSTLSRLASGRIRRLDLAVLERLCEFFQCQPGDLVVRQPDPKTQSPASR